jgi:pyruvate kinase
MLMKAPKGGDNLFQKSLTDKRPDQIFRKTKIISTLGKHTSNLVSFKSFLSLIQEAICKLIEQGTNIFRINMSTIQNKEHKILIEMIKKAQKLTKVKVGVMIDLQGPVIRTCEFREKSSVSVHSV